MRKQLLGLTMGLLLFSQLALAQDDGSSNTLDYGVKFGGNFNQFNQPGTIIGGNAGGFARLNMLDWLGFQGELLYDYQGGGRHDFSPAYANDNTNSGTVSTTFINRKLQLHTASLPLSVRLTPFSRDSNITFYLLVGGSAEYIWAAFEERDVLFQSDNLGDVILTGQNQSVTDEIEDFQAGWHFGAGFDLYQTDGRVISVEARYRQSMMNINPGREDFSNSLRADFAGLYSSTFSINFYATLNPIF